MRVRTREEQAKRIDFGISIIFHQNRDLISVCDSLSMDKTPIAKPPPQPNRHHATANKTGSSHEQLAMVS